MSLIAIIMLILAFLGFGFFSTGPDVAVSTVVPATEVVVEVPASGWALIEVDGVQGVIVPEDDASGFGLGDSYWTPSVVDVIEAEEAIVEAEGPLDHTRQYAGIVEDGVQKVLVNGFCSDEPDWMSEPIIVMDGGECFFTAIYNVETAELELFTFNGVA